MCSNSLLSSIPTSHLPIQIINLDDTFLQNDVNSRQASLEVYRKYIKDLLKENISIISSIMEQEEKTVSGYVEKNCFMMCCLLQHCSTDRILERYKHFKVS